MAGLTTVLAELTLVKIGCAGLRSRASWRNAWNEVRSAATATLSERPEWVAVAYADWEAADAPPVSEILRVTLAEDCCGMLIDTSTKSDRWLLDWISPAQLQDIADEVHSQGRFLALAGSLKASQLSQLKSVAVDVLAIRGAACLQGQRTSEISESAVRDFKHQIEICWHRDAL